jgi:hypothetical protein
MSGRLRSILTSLSRGGGEVSILMVTM